LLHPACSGGAFGRFGFANFSAPNYEKYQKSSRQELPVQEYSQHALSRFWINGASLKDGSGISFNTSILPSFHLGVIVVDTNAEL